MANDEIIDPMIGDVWEDIDLRYIEKFGKKRELTVKKILSVQVKGENKTVVICASNIRRINATVSPTFLNIKFRLKSRKVTGTNEANS